MSREAVRAIVESARDIEPGRPLISRRAADITPEPVKWLWPNRIAIGKNPPRRRGRLGEVPSRR